MGEGAILSVLVDFQKPDYRGQEDNRRLHKEIALFLNPRLVQIQEYGICRFVGIRNIRHEVRMYRVAPVAAHGVIEIDDVELDPLRVFILILYQMVIHDSGEVRIFEVVAIKREPFLYLLFKEVVHHCERLARTGGAQHYCCAERIYHVYPSLVPLLLVVELSGKIDGIWILQQPCFLHE